jgi:hypothetical protein
MADTNYSAVPFASLDWIPASPWNPTSPGHAKDRFAWFPHVLATTQTDCADTRLGAIETTIWNPGSTSSAL